MSIKFVTYERLYPDYGIPYSDRQLRRLEEKGHFPKRVALVKGGSFKGWPSQVLDAHLAKLAEMSTQ